MWRELIENLAGDEGIEFAHPTTTSQIAQAEEAVGVLLPDDLRQLLAETNGVWAFYGAAVVLPAERIQELNIEYWNYPTFRELYIPFDPLLFFGEEGNGDLYAYIITADQIRRPDIFVWDHETDSRTWFASNLQDYLTRRFREQAE